MRLVDFNNFARRRLYAGQGLRQIVMEAFGDEPQLWIGDGFNCNARRREIYPEYKRNRDDSFGDSVFAALDFLKEALKHTEASYIEVPGYEADDVIATIAKEVAGTEPITIESNDLDLFALTALPGVTMYRDSPVAPDQVQLFKTLTGDPSDNIPGVAGLGVKTFQKYDWGGIKDSLVKKLPYPKVEGLPEKLALKLTDDWENIQKWWAIVNFFEVPQEEILGHMTVGDCKPNQIQYPDEF